MRKMKNDLKNAKTVNKKEKSKYTAVALSYDEALMDAPEVSAIGHERLAKTMRSVARRYGVPVISDKKLTKQLSEVPETEAVPEELYQDVAKLIQRINVKKKAG